MFLYLCVNKCDIAVHVLLKSQMIAKVVDKSVLPQSSCSTRTTLSNSTCSEATVLSAAVCWKTRTPCFTASLAGGIRSPTSYLQDPGVRALMSVLPTRIDNCTHSVLQLCDLVNWDQCLTAWLLEFLHE